MNRLAIVGGGSWGTALAIALAPRFEHVALWIYERDLADRMRASRENDVYLPGFKLPRAVAIETEFAPALADAEIVLGVVPSHHLRRVFSAAAAHLAPHAILVSAAKGVEHGTLLRMSQVLAQAAPAHAIAALSGPTFAREIAAGEPAAVVIASETLSVAERVQEAFSGPALRLYSSQDVTGVELGAAFKNVIAIGAGVCHGLGLGSNTQAALITRGLAEITRLAVAMGGQPQTLAGLAGLGDLVLTCTGALSRNRSLGTELAKGRKLAEITASTRMIAEGVETCAVAVELGRKFTVDLPIMEQMYAVLYAEKPPHEALRDLMARSLKAE